MLMEKKFQAAKSRSNIDSEKNNDCKYKHLISAKPNLWSIGSSLFIQSHFASNYQWKNG